MKCSTGILLLVLATCQAAKLPAYFKKCKSDDPNLTKCLTASGNDGWPTLVYGDKNIHFLNADPMDVAQMYVDVDGNLLINLTNVTISNLHNLKLNEIKLDLNKKTLDIDMHLDRCITLGHYDIKGRILVLPIVGNGKANITYIGGKYKLHMDFEIIEKNNKHYMKPLKTILPYELDRAYFQLDNLFNGNKLLADNMNTVLNENWREVNAEIGSKIGEALGQVFGAAIGSIFRKVPLEELFIDYS